MFNNFKDDRNIIVRSGDILHDCTRAIVYHALYPIFSIVRAAWRAVKDSWEDTE